MEYIKSSISESVARKIIGNKSNATDYLYRLQSLKPGLSLPFTTVLRGKEAGKTVLNVSTTELWNMVVSNWDYDVSRVVIREMFTETAKYLTGLKADGLMAALITEWRTSGLGPIAWPFSQGAFDDFVQGVNNDHTDGGQKDEKVKDAAVRYRRIKEINTLRNDFIETLIFEKNQNILPTLSHRRGVDFFIDGVSYDQKVAKSPTAEFKKRFKDNWREAAISSPGLVAEYLYRYQDEGRFGADPRLLVVYLDEDVSTDQIRRIVNQTDLINPTEITFTYSHKSGGDRSYKVPCFVILLHN